jgi:uncharacterized protein
MSLLMKPCCECCGTATLPEATNALICSFECTFCKKCAALMNSVCPNCRGTLVARPTRAAHLLDRHPVSTKREVKSNGCDANEV